MWSAVLTCSLTWTEKQTVSQTAHTSLNPIELQQVSKAVQKTLGSILALPQMCPSDVCRSVSQESSQSYRVYCYGTEVIPHVCLSEQLSLPTPLLLLLS